MRKYMVLVFVLLLVLLRNSYAKYRKTDTCPTSFVQWRIRESMFACPPETPYHCILLYNSSQLYEACIASVPLAPSKEGCPWILFHRGTPVHGSKNNLCPETNPECPSSDHKGYLTNQLYQYQACFLPVSARIQEITTRKDSSSSTTSNGTQIPESDDSSPLLVTVTITCIVLIVIVVVIILAVVVIQRSKQRGIIQATSRTPEIKTKGENVIADGDVRDQMPLIQIGGNVINDRDNEVQLVSKQIGGNVIAVGDNEEQLASKQIGGDVIADGDNEEQFASKQIGGDVIADGDNEEQLASKQIGEDVIADDDIGDNIEQLASKQIDGCVQRKMLKKDTGQQSCGSVYSVGNENVDIMKRLHRLILQDINGIADYNDIELREIEENILPEDMDLVKILRMNKDYFHLFGSSTIDYAAAICPGAKICDEYNHSEKCEQKGCNRFHICLLFIKRMCNNDDCKLSHSFSDDHNSALKKTLDLDYYTDDEMQKIIRNNYPQICQDPGCPGGSICPYLHFCPDHCNSKEARDMDCQNNHSLHTKHNKLILMAYNIKGRQLNNTSYLESRFSKAEPK